MPKGPEKLGGSRPRRAILTQLPLSLLLPLHSGLLTTVPPTHKTALKSRRKTCVTLGPLYNERASPRNSEWISLTSNCQNYTQGLILNQTLARGKDEEAIVLYLWLENSQLPLDITVLAERKARVAESG